MATLTAGQTTTFGLDAWASLTLVVDGKATLAFTSQAPTVMSSFDVTNATSKTYGPYGVPMSVVITAVDRGLTFDVSNLYHKANTVVVAGDSLANQNYATTSNNYVAIQSSGAFEVANALSGQRFTLLRNVAAGGKTAAQVLTEQMPSIVALAPKYCYLSMGVNDLYVDLVSGEVAYKRMISVIEALMSAGITPLWSTVIGRTANAAVTDDHLWCNDLLRQYAASENCGIFFDAYRITQNPGSATFGPRSGWKYDSSPAIHSNNVEAYWVGKALFKALDAHVPKTYVFANGPEDQTNSANNKSNILVNPFFAGTGGTVSANCTGTMPDSWTIDWATRTGTGSAAASIVDVTDPDTGVAIAKGIQVVLSGTIAANDVLRITQASGFNTQISGGDLISAEGVLTMTSPVLFLQNQMRVQANTNEATNYGANGPAASGSGSYEAFPESATLYMRTQKMPVLGTGAASAARYDLRMTFSGAATGTFILSQPRVRVG